MTKKEALQIVRKPEQWNDSFFNSVVRFDQKVQNLLRGIVHVELPDYKDRFKDEIIKADLRRLEEEKAALTVPAASAVKSKPVSWLYKPYIPRGKVTLIAANPGTGKTFLMCYIAARVSTGREIFPQAAYTMDLNTLHEYKGTGMSYGGSGAGNALYITAEDGASDTIRPRLEWCGANLDRVFIKSCESESLTYSGEEFRKLVTNQKYDLIICDPFQSFFSEKADINAPNKTRAQLFPVIRLAEETGAAIVLVCHLNKDRQGGIITRVLGSMDIVGACRSFLAVGNVPGKTKGLKFISHEKSSLAQRGDTYLFELDPENGGIITRGGSDLSFDDYTALERAYRKKSGEKTEAAKQFLTEQMPKGSRPYKELLEAAKEIGLSRWSLEKAAEDIGIIKKRGGFAGGSVWYLPGHDPENQ